MADKESALPASLSLVAIPLIGGYRHLPTTNRYSSTVFVSEAVFAKHPVFFFSFGSAALRIPTTTARCNGVTGKDTDWKPGTAGWSYGGCVGTVAWGASVLRAPVGSHVYNLLVFFCVCASRHQLNLCRNVLCGFAFASPCSLISPFLLLLHANNVFCFLEFDI